MKLLINLTVVLALLEPLALNGQMKQAQAAPQQKAAIPAPVQPMAAKPVVTAVAPPVAPVKPVVVAPPVIIELPYQIRLNQLYATPALPAKIAGARDVLAFIGPSSGQVEKSAVIKYYNDLFLMQGLMDSTELLALRNAFISAAQNQFLLAQNQRLTMDQWIKTLTAAAGLAEQTETLLVTVKKNITKQKENFDLAVKTAVCACQLLETKLPPDEVDRKKNTSLIAIVRAELPVFYNNRANKKLSELDSLKNLFDSAKKNKDCADVIGKKWDDSLNIMRAIVTAQSSPNVLAGIVAYQNVFKQLTPSTNRFEKQLFVDGLSTIFLDRKERALKELSLFKQLITDVIASGAKQSNLFEKSELELFTAWDKILDGTVALLKAQEISVSIEKINLIKNILPNINNSQADYEKKLLVPLLTDIFAGRGDMIALDLLATKGLFLAAKATTNLLASNQISVLIAWLKELDDALVITKGTKTYSQTLLDFAMAGNDIAKYTKAIDLLTKPLDKDMANRLVASLNNLFSQRQSLDKVAMKKLFLMIDQKKNGVNYLLNSDQRLVLEQWIKMLEV